MQLGAAGIAPGKLAVHLDCGLVVFGAEGGVVLPVPFTQQHLEHDGLLGHVVSQPLPLALA